MDEKLAVVDGVIVSTSFTDQSSYEFKLLSVIVEIPEPIKYVGASQCEVKVPASYADKLRVGEKVRVTIERLP